MGRAAALLALAALMTPGALPARLHQHHVHARSVGGGSEDHYVARSGHLVHRPMTSAARPPGATAQCRDRTWSFSESRRGTCSHHGGVAAWS